jgi:hypothetical protein
MEITQEGNKIKNYTTKSDLWSCVLNETNRSVYPH